MRRESITRLKTHLLQRWFLINQPTDNGTRKKSKINWRRKVQKQWNCEKYSQMWVFVHYTGLYSSVVASCNIAHMWRLAVVKIIHNNNSFYRVPVWKFIFFFSFRFIHTLFERKMFIIIMYDVCTVRRPSTKSTDEDVPKYTRARETLSMKGKKMQQLDYYYYY